MLRRLESQCMVNGQMTKASEQMSTLEGDKVSQKFIPGTRYVIVEQTQ